LRLTNFLSECVGRGLMLSSPKVWGSLGLRHWSAPSSKRRQESASRCFEGPPMVAGPPVASLAHFYDVQVSRHRAIRKNTASFLAARVLSISSFHFASGFNLSIDQHGDTVPAHQGFHHRLELFQPMVKVRWGFCGRPLTPKRPSALTPCDPSLIPAAPAHAPAAPSTPIHGSVLVGLRGCQLLGG